MSERCRSCKAPILWANTANGKLMPVDAEPCDDGTVALLRDGCLLFAITRKLAVGHTLFYKSHFASCPNAKGWRKHD